MATRRYQAPALAQLVDLFLIELTNWRWSWRSMLLTGTLAPVFSILAMGIFARDAGQQALTYVLTGNMVISLMFGNMGNVQSHFTFMRFQGALDYYATLPIRKPLLILAVVLSFLLLSAPSLIVTTLLGALVLRVPIHLHPLVLVVIPACAIPLSGIGALIGANVRNHYQANALSLIVTMVMAGLGPVVIPPDVEFDGKTLRSTGAFAIELDQYDVKRPRLLLRAISNEIKLEGKLVAGLSATP